MAAAPASQAAGRVAEGAMRSRIVGLVLLASLSASAVFGALWTLGAQVHARHEFDETSQLRVELAAARLRAELDGAVRELEGLAAGDAVQRAAAVAAPPTGAVPDPGTPAAEAQSELLRASLARTRSFRSALVLDRLGERVAAVGPSAGLAELASLLEPKSAIDAELGTVMQGVQLRKDLGGVETAGVRLLDLAGTAPLVLASAPVRDAEGRAIASLHAEVTAEVLRAALRSGAADGAAPLRLTDEEGRVVASSDAERARPTATDAGPAPLAAALVGLLGRDWAQQRTRPLEFLGARLSVEQTALQAVGPAAVTLLLACGIALGLGVLFGASAFWSSTRMLRPLWSLLEGLRRAGTGEVVRVDPPHVDGEAELLIRAFNDAVERLAQRRLVLEQECRSLRDQNQAFQALQQNLSQLTITDPLTELANRRYFEEQLSREIKRLSRQDDGLSMLVVDIDDFKKLNDQFGHAAGDEFLRQVARILREGVRATDLLARYGGEEFVIVATSTALDGALVLAEKLRTAVAEASFIVDATMRPRRATISIGVAEYRGSQTDLFNSADAALYEAKAAGKNCVVAAGQDAAHS